MLAVSPLWLQKDINPRPHDLEEFVMSAKFLQGLYGNNRTITYLPIYPQHSRCLYNLLSLMLVMTVKWKTSILKGVLGYGFY